MKNLLFILVFCAISAHGQTGEITFQSTTGIGELTDFIIYDHETTPRWNISGASIERTLYVGGIENKKEIDSIHQSGDTLIIYRKWFIYTSPGGPGTMCLVLGCTSDHKAHFRDRIIFVEQSGELKFIRREVGELKTVETTTKNIKWVYRK